MILNNKILMLMELRIQPQKQEKKWFIIFDKKSFTLSSPLWLRARWSLAEMVGLPSGRSWTQSSRLFMVTVMRWWWCNDDDDAMMMMMMMMMMMIIMFMLILSLNDVDNDDVYDDDDFYLSWRSPSVSVTDQWNVCIFQNLHFFEKCKNYTNLLMTFQTLFFKCFVTKLFLKCNVIVK